MEPPLARAGNRLDAWLVRHGLLLLPAVLEPFVTHPLLHGDIMNQPRSDTTNTMPLMRPNLLRLRMKRSEGGNRSQPNTSL